MIERPSNLPDTSYLSKLDRQTIAEDARYKEEIMASRPTVFFRPGDRTDPSNPTFFQADANGLSYIGFIEEYGSHEERRPPRFSADRIAVRVRTRELRKISELTPEEYAHAYSDLKSPADILRWLQQKYPRENLTLESLITVYEIEYEPPQNESAD